ncbi:MAG: flavodoxin family protein [Candidatus Heimdallarchaeota archaeon]|nr:flavodoxin family protein [Candidatus Heimdallarchaeota archaeon]
MNVLIIFAHPNEESFGYALLKNFQIGLVDANNQIEVHNLYSDKFNPILTKEELLDASKLEEDPLIMKYRKDIQWANIIVIMHPAYWYSTPAILKGYFDRILVEGFAYDYVNENPIPKLLNKKGILIQTFDTEEHLEKSLFEDITYKTVYFTWKYCGIENWKRFTLFRVNFVSNEKREEWLKQIYTFGLNIEK